MPGGLSEARSLHFLGHHLQWKRQPIWEREPKAQGALGHILGGAPLPGGQDFARGRQGRTDAFRNLKQLRLGLRLRDNLYIHAT